MFGMGFSEILIILVIGVLFLGPDKLPEAMVKIAKFFNAFKKTINEAKDAIDKELKIEDLKKEALEYKRRLHETTEDIKSTMNIDEIKEIQKGTTNISQSIKDNIEQAVSSAKDLESKPNPKKDKTKQVKKVYGYKEEVEKEEKNV